MTTAIHDTDPKRKKGVTFDNTEIAFRSKTKADLRRSYWLFRIIANNFLTKIGSPITNFALNLGLPIKGIVRKTIFAQFCGGETIEACEETIQQLASQRVGTILDYSVEGEDTEIAFDRVLLELLAGVERAKKDKNIPFCVFKITGLGRFELLEKMNAKESLTSQELAEFIRVRSRVDRICKAAEIAHIKVLIDAEHSWIQDTIDDIAREMMQQYNRQKPVVYNTYQLYRHDEFASLKADYFLAKTDGFYLGVKVVRGAYMEIERERAKKLNYPSPIQPDKEASDRDFNLAVEFCLDHLDQMGFMAGTHNENSCNLLAHEIDKRGIARDDQRIFFSQLLGMSDNLSFNLSDAGYNVAKYMPYGPIKAVMPYLMRRAQENTSVAGQTSRELSLIMQEMNRRKR